MPDGKSNDPAGAEKPDLRASLLDAWEQIRVLVEKVDDLDRQQTAMLIALANTLPHFAPEYDRAYKTIGEKRKNSENE